MEEQRYKPVQEKRDGSYITLVIYWLYDMAGVDIIYNSYALPYEFPTNNLCILGYKKLLYQLIMEYWTQ